MANHDNYDMDLLKALENIAKSLKSIDSLLRDLALYKTSFGIIETEEKRMINDEMYKICKDCPYYYGEINQCMDGEESNYSGY